MVKMNIYSKYISGSKSIRAWRPLHEKKKGRNQESSELLHRIHSTMTVRTTHCCSCEECTSKHPHVTMTFIQDSNSRCLPKYYYTVKDALKKKVEVLMKKGKWIPDKPKKPKCPPIFYTSYICNFIDSFFF